MNRNMLYLTPPWFTTRQPQLEAIYLWLNMTGKQYNGIKQYKLQHGSYQSDIKSGSITNVTQHTLCHTCVSLQIWASGWCQAIVSGWGGLHRGWRVEGVRSRARGGRVVVQAVGVAGTSTFSAITVDGSLQLTWRTQALLLTLKRVQIFHVPTRTSFIWVTWSGTNEHYFWNKDDWCLTDQTSNASKWVPFLTQFPHLDKLTSYIISYSTSSYFILFLWLHQKRMCVNAATFWAFLLQTRGTPTGCGEWRLHWWWMWEGWGLWWSPSRSSC